MAVTSAPAALIRDAQVWRRVWAADGWRAIDARRAYAHAKAGGTIYQAALRDELMQRLGVSWQTVEPLQDPGRHR